MTRSIRIREPAPELLPVPVGYQQGPATLCVGLDIAWFGGSKNNPDSQFDCIAAAVFEPGATTPEVDYQRVPLPDRDLDASKTVDALLALFRKFSQRTTRIVLAIDAPLQTTQGLPAPPRQKAFRDCERHFSRCRRAIDKAAGGSSGWHPNVQPGVPLAPRVVKLLEKLNTARGPVPWTAETSQSAQVAIECFPAEAIWAAKRLGQYPPSLVAANAKAYKSQAGSRLTAAQVRGLVETTLLDSFKNLSGVPQIWPGVVEDALLWMLGDQTWQKGGQYRGGKLLDDVVDSSICLATALSYAANNAHVWHDPTQPADGHIIGPGRFSYAPATTGEV